MQEMTQGSADGSPSSITNLLASSKVTSFLWGPSLLDARDWRWWGWWWWWLHSPLMVSGWTPLFLPCNSAGGDTYVMNEKANWWADQRWTAACICRPWKASSAVGQGDMVGREARNVSFSKLSIMRWEKIKSCFCKWSPKHRGGLLPR